MEDESNEISYGNTDEADETDKNRFIYFQKTVFQKLFYAHPSMHSHFIRRKAIVRFKKLLVAFLFLWSHEEVFVFSFSDSSRLAGWIG